MIGVWSAPRNPMFRWSAYAQGSNRSCFGEGAMLRQPLSRPPAPMPEEYNLLFFGHQKTTRIAMTIIVNPSCIIVASSIICVPNLGEKIPV